MMRRDSNGKLAGNGLKRRDFTASGDYDGDGKFDAAVFRPSGNNWYISGSTAGTIIRTFGTTGDQPVPNAFIQ
jgi:FG-GAP repeat